MVEPLASRVPWMIGYGNHELVPLALGRKVILLQAALLYVINP
jgi:hypothetical protein